jgi:hypothetical protein
MDGEDFVFVYTPATSGYVTITLTNTLTYTGVFVTQGCPDVGSCVNYAENSAGNPVLTSLPLTGGVTYYIIVDTWPAPDCTPFDINIVSVTPSYCNSNFTSATYEFITNVTFAGINNTSAGNIGGPVDYTAQVANVSKTGGPYTLSVTIDPDALDYVYVWIDWDQNFTLNDAGETYTVVASTSLPGPHTINITVPAGATLGNTRMRVMVDYNNAVPNPCRSATWGEAEDYTVNVAP